MINLFSQNNNLGYFEIFFYNSENFFDTVDDKGFNDEEFTPNSDKKWDYYKYRKKLVSIYKVIAAASDGRPPALIALCEIENRGVLEDLINKTPLSLYNYKILHKESPDYRGIDVALIYDSDILYCSGTNFLEVNLDGGSTTRDVLISNFSYGDKNLIISVNHWPSQRGGAIYSENKRIKAASTLLDGLNKLYPDNENVVIVGDLNTEENSPSLSYLINSDKNLRLLTKDLGGSHKYKGVWAQLDHVIISDKMLSPDCDLCVKTEFLRLIKEDFMLEKDPKYGGYKPYRTYLGPRYIGGYSDHLPIVLRVY